MAKHDEPEGAGGHAGVREDAEFELHVEALSHPTATSSRALPSPSRRGRSRVVGLALCALTLVAAGAFALARGGELGSAPQSPPARVQPPIATRSTPTSTLVAYPTPTLGGGTPTALGPAPAACTPPAPAPRAFSSSFVRAIGATPVWVAGFDGPQATKHTGAGGLGYSRYGWLTNLLFVVEPGFADLVVVRGVRLGDGSPLWIGVLGPGQTYYEATPSVVAILDPQRPGLPRYESYSVFGDEGWAMWEAALYLPAAGCYALEASWPGGSWRLSFAAGR